MCMWTQGTRTTFETVITKMVLTGKPFDTLAVRDQMRTAVGLGTDINYNDVFSELWHYYRKGKFVQPYLVRTKTVVIDTANGDTTVTVEYVPEAGTVLKKVREQWATANSRTSGAV